MNYILMDGPNRDNLLPATFTRPVSEIRIGISKISEKWEHLLDSSISFETQQYLSAKYPKVCNPENVFIDGSIIPTKELAKAIVQLKENETLVKSDKTIAVRTPASRSSDIDLSILQKIEFQSEYIEIKNTWDIFHFNPQVIRSDFDFMTLNRKSAPLSDTNSIIGDKSLIFIEEGADAEYTYLNTTDGPIYIGKGATIMEGSKIRGPFALCDNATIKMDAKIYSGTTIGPFSKVGGEVSNSVIFGYSNKGHDGFLGNSVLGEWCNLGADTNTSNLKNTYDYVRLWSYAEKTFVNTGLQFCGLIMGDHSKSGINTMFNTGTVVGVSSNIYGAGFQRNFIPSFTWGGAQGLKPFNFKKSVQVATAVYKRRNKEFDNIELEIFEHINKIDQS